MTDTFTNDQQDQPDRRTGYYVPDTPPAPRPPMMRPPAQPAQPPYTPDQIPEPPARPRPPPPAGPPDPITQRQGWRPPFQLPLPRNADGWGTEFGPVGSSGWYPGQQISPALPSYRESLGIIGSAGRQLSQWTAPGIGGLFGLGSQQALQLAPILDILSKGAFSKNFFAAQEGRLQLQQNQMILQTEQAMMQHKQMLLEFGQIYQTFNAGGINEEQADKAVEAMAVKYGHQNLIGILKNKGLGAVEQYLKWEDAQHMAMQAALESSKKGSKDGGADPYSSGAGGGEFEPRQEKNPVNPPDVTAGEPARPGVAGVDTPTSLDTQIAHQLGLNQTGMQAAHAILNGADVPKNSKNLNLEPAAQGLAAEVSKIAQGQGSADEKIRQIGEKVDRNLAANLSGLYHAQIDPKATNRKGLGRMMSWMASIDPSWNESNYDAAKSFNNPQSPERLNLTRANALGQAITSVMQALAPVSETEKVPIRAIEAGETVYFSGDPKYTQLYQALTNLVTETIAVQSGRGTPRVMLVKMMAAHLNGMTMSPAQLRTQIQTDARNAFTVAKGYNRDWKNLTRQNTDVPGWSPPAEEIEDAFQRMNPFTGVQAADAPAQLKAYSKPGTARPSWMRDEQTYVPLTKEQEVKGREMLQKYANDPDPKVQAQLQEIRRRLGPLLDY